MNIDKIKSQLHSVSESGLKWVEQQVGPERMAKIRAVLSDV